MFHFHLRRRPVARVRAERAFARRRALSGLVAMSLLFALTASQALGEESRIDLNHATAEQLAELPGIGAAKAAAIVAHRRSAGAFGAVEELEAVRGIGPALVAKLRPLVTLGARGAAKPKARGAATK